MSYVTQWKKAATVLLVVWVLVTYLVLSPMRCSSNIEDGRIAEFQERLYQASSQIESLKSQHSKLVAQLKSNGLGNQVLQGFDEYLDSGNGPPEEYEALRRRVYTNVKELWNFLNKEIDKIAKTNPEYAAKSFREDVASRKRSLLNDMDDMRKLDGYEGFRKAEAANVSDLVQRRLHYLQNPEDCKSARKLLCHLNKGCGFGCQLHHLLYCLIFAYATERTLILNSKGWRYNPSGWEYIFQPLSDSCTNLFDEHVQYKTQWSGDTNDQVISLPFIDSMMSKRPKFLPLAIPKDLAKRILRFNGDPASWWIGQMLKYVMKPTQQTQAILDDIFKKMEFRNPIVGVHIRRTDKVGTEASFHGIDEYMKHVEDYFKTLEMKGESVPVRRVYLASDDASVLEDARKKYPGYKFLGDRTIAMSAATHRRYSPNSLYGLLADLQLLANTDFLVCTFSSQVGRVAYQMMQANRMDASENVRSLDDIYYYGGQNAHQRVVVIPHTATLFNEINAQVGDLIGIAGNHWDGYAVGVNSRTNQKGLIPWYKTNDHLVLYPFPEYREVPLYRESKEENKVRDNL